MTTINAELNRAKHRLELLLNIMRENNWYSYKFPGHTLRFGQLYLVLLKGQCLPDKTRPPQMKEPHRCWFNAREAQADNSALKYYEGFIANKDSAWPTPHAWNMLDGKVYDTTVNSDEYDYFGFDADVNNDITVQG